MKTAWITGGSRGIGRAAARRLVQDGWNVAIQYEKAEQAALGLKEELGRGCCEIFRADVANEAEVRRTAQQIRERFGKIDLLVCNAGISHIGLLSDMSLAAWERLFAVNVTGAFLCCREVIGEMVSRQAGTILLVSSMWGLTGASCEAAYSASKAALIGLGRALAQELGPSGIRVNCIAPGAIETDMNRGLDEEARRRLVEETPLGRMGTPEEVAQTIAFLASDAGSYYTGQVLSPNGGMVIA